jgi:V/A-type H+-transporting ATPase subunit A
MQEMVYVGDARLTGEVIAVDGKATTIQVYESTTGLRPGEPVFSTGNPMSVTLGPGLLKNIFDGIERPLREIEALSGAFIRQGADVERLDAKRKWRTVVGICAGGKVRGGQIFARCQETPLIEHRCLVPPLIEEAEVIYAAPDGEYTVDDVIAKVRDKKGREGELKLAQRWPIRIPRPALRRLAIEMPLVTGQRIIDSVFPIAKGGAAAVPGGFGTGKTMTQHQLAKWCDADIIVYIGCGERGNEMTQVLEEFSELIDPSTGQLLTNRTILIANTSNMPVAAREASIYTGITLAEYYRDMGYHVAIMADSTSRWAEALREISGRLEEMPAEEGFPAYLPSRLSQFYERAGYMQTLCGADGSVSIIGAVSPQGSDFSEPVTQNTKRFVRCFWALDKSLAYARHYPAINWNNSYSEYVEELGSWYAKNVSGEFFKCRQEILTVMNEENKLMEIVKLIGSDVLPDDQKLIIEVARVVRIGFLQQNAYHKDDTYVPLEKQFKMMKTILYLYRKSKELIIQGRPFSEIVSTGIFDRVVKIKYDVPNDRLELFDAYYRDIDEALKGAKA